MIDNTVPFMEPAPADSRLQDDRLVYVGRDHNGVPLEVMAVATTDGILVIHAMRMRKRYAPYL